MRIGQYVLGALFGAFVVIVAAAGLIGDWMWFGAVGYENVFLTVVMSSALIGLFSFIVFFSFCAANVAVARRLSAGKSKKSGKGAARAMNFVALLLALIAALAMAGSWQVFLKAENATAFGVVDPVFGMDVGFYAFTLPYYYTMLGFALSMLVVSAFLSALTYVFTSAGFKVETVEVGSSFSPFIGGATKTGVNFKWKGSWKGFLPHVSVLLSAIFVVLAGFIWLARYGILLSGDGAVFGAGYTDIAVNLPMMSILSGLAFVIGMVLLANIRLRRPRFLVYAIGAFIVVSVIGGMVSGVVQGLVVQPDEFNLEKAYLQRNIDWTLAAYGLDGAQEQIFPISYDLNATGIAENNATIGNIRLWDWRPLSQTYNQLQLFRTYYDFNDVDVDRYQIDGMYKEVLVSAREMETNQLTEQAQTWVNEHLVYTHGYGVVMNPVDQVTPQGLPRFYIKDIPPQSQFFSLDQMRIYYGERTHDYAITQSATEEFDYPSGDENIYTSYSGAGGVPLSDGFRKLIYALKFSSPELLVSGSLTPDSRILMNREIVTRTSEIAPFLLYDGDPYVVLSGGRLYWMLDAYTTSDMYPYSEPVYMGWNGFNYMRNSVKVVVDAYNGDVSYYVVDPEDPLIETYSKMFPGLFRDFSEMPDGLKAHIRYPELLFSTQAQIYSTYHMKDPMVFYNKEDVWVIPDEIYRGNRQEMQPYYVIMKLPGEEDEEFILMIPFTPKGKENMVAWMAARSDQPNYGKVLVYQFSKQELTYGPMQIEARIDQDTDISQLITLWSQSGSSVVRGNTLVIPIDNSIMYVEPLYLEATQKGTLPQLQRVIVAYGDRLTMKPTLTEALDEIFGAGAAPSGSSGNGEPQPTQTDMEKLKKIAELYDLAQQALAAGDLGGYQNYVNQIGELVSG